MKMDAFAHLVKHRETAARKIKVHKTYINEDPNEEVETTCPKCWSRNQQSTVRYMYINMNEAIYKCEAANCMYPFRDFKYKNYVDNTVYYYTALDVEEPAPILGEFPPSFLEPRTRPSPVKPCNTSLFDFNLECFSPEKATSGGASVTLGDIKTPDRNIFDSPSIRNLVKDFDTGFIDDILSELGGVPGSPEKKPSPIARITPPKPAASSKQLKRCLQMFQQTSSTASQSVFKVPQLPGTEPTISPKQKSHRKSPGHHRRHKHSRRPKHQSPTSAAAPTTPVVTMSAGQMLQKSRMKPLQFIESLNSIKPADGKDPAPAINGIQRLGNQKVERMLNFIERSMKKREPSPAPTPTPSSPSSSSVESSPERPTKRAATSKRKEVKKLSLSAAVLQDTQFQYDSADEPVPEASPVEPVAVKEEVMQVEAPTATVANSLLPSFGELLDFIHPADAVETKWKHKI